MSRSRAVRTLALTGLLAATLALAGTTPAVADDRSTTGRVDPTQLATGKAPDVPWLDMEASRLHQPGRRTVSVHTSGLLLHARGGFVLGTGDGAVFAGPTGKQRYLDRSPGFTPILTSETGAWVVLRKELGQRLRVVRTSDGRLVRGRVLPAGWSAQVIAAGDGQVLLSLVRISSGQKRTVLWNPVRNTTRTLVERQATAASFGAHRVVVTAGNRQLMLDLRTKKVLWSTPSGKRRPYERAVLFSPDDKRVLTLAPPTESLGQSDVAMIYETLRIRDVRTGRLLTTLRGHFEPMNYGRPELRNTVWETPTRLLLPAGTEPQRDDEGEYSPLLPNRSIVRCSATTTHCVKVPVDYDTTALMVRRSN